MMTIIKANEIIFVGYRLRTVVVYSKMMGTLEIILWCPTRVPLEGQKKKHNKSILLPVVHSDPV